MTKAQDKLYYNKVNLKGVYYKSTLPVSTLVKSER